MSSESVCQVARSWVEVGSFQIGVVYFAIVSVRELLDTPSYGYLHFWASLLIPDSNKSKMVVKKPVKTAGAYG
jgi:hypothetical protein